MSPTKPESAPSGSLNISVNADFTMDPSSVSLVPAIMYLEDTVGNPLVITNNGYMHINDILEGKGAIHGTGILEINNTGTLRLAAGESSFTVDGDSWIKGTLQLTVDPTVPEPSTYALLGVGVVCWGGYARRRRRK